MDLESTLDERSEFARFHATESVCSAAEGARLYESGETRDSTHSSNERGNAHLHQSVTDIKALFFEIFTLTFYIHAGA